MLSVPGLIPACDKCIFINTLDLKHSYLSVMYNKNLIMIKLFLFRVEFLSLAQGGTNIS